MRCSNILRDFFPLGSVGFCRWLASGRGSRGWTPLHKAARKGHDSVVQRLLEAKAAVDIQNKSSRGLGGGYRFTDGSTFWWILFYLFGKRVQTFAPMFGAVVCEHDNIVPTLWVGVSWNQSCPSQFKLFLRFRSVHSDMVYAVIKHCLTVSLFAVLTNRRNLCFFQLIYELGLLRDYTKYLLHGTDFKFCCVPIARIFVFLEMAHFLSFLKAF